jgi:hypothetical protein
MRAHQLPVGSHRQARLLPSKRNLLSRFAPAKVAVARAAARGLPAPLTPSATTERMDMPRGAWEAGSM